jgi:hypothetical protein
MLIRPLSLAVPRTKQGFGGTVGSGKKVNVQAKRRMSCVVIRSELKPVGPLSLTNSPNQKPTTLGKTGFGGAATLVLRDGNQKRYREQQHSHTAASRLTFDACDITDHDNSLIGLQYNEKAKAASAQTGHRLLATRPVRRFVSQARPHRPFLFMCRFVGQDLIPIAFA